MNDLHTALRTKEQADGTLRWGGLAGILGSLLISSPSASWPRSWG